MERNFKFFWRVIALGNRQEQKTVGRGNQRSRTSLLKRVVNL